MKKIYNLNYSKRSVELDNMDLSRRKKIEEIRGKPFLSDYEWINYKTMVIPRKK